MSSPYRIWRGRAAAVPVAALGVLGALLAVPATAQAADTVTLQGVVRDGSGHGWPLWASVSVDGVPAATTYTKPRTGRYALTLPAAGTYTVHVYPQNAGYTDATRQVEVGTSGTTTRFRLDTDAHSCVAAGYHHTTGGLLEDFGSGATPDGWTVVDNIGSGNAWRFDDPGERGNHTGGRGGFAILDSDYYGYDVEYQGREDASLVSPPVDLTGVADPAVGFDSDFTMWDYDEPSGLGDVDVSIDGGATWQNVWHVDMSAPGPQQVTVPLPAAAGQPDVRVRFHYHEAADITAGRWWAVDGVFIGNRNCDPVPGGLVVGQVRDANTGRPVVGAQVRTDRGSTTSVATPDDTALRDGFYSMFVPGPGRHELTVSKLQYAGLSQQVLVGADAVRVANLALPTGRIAVGSNRLASSQPLGRTRAVPLSLTNTGTAPVTVSLAERPGDFDLLAADGEPWHDLGDPAADRGWKSLPDYPTAIRDNVAATYDGKVYSAGGVPNTTFGAPTAAGYVYDPDVGEWQRIADMPQPRQEATGGFIDGKLYVVDGTTGDFGQVFAPQVDIYDPATDSWSTGASIPVVQADAASAVLDGELYVVGGCDTRFRCGSSGVFRYDPATDTWDTLADYPEALSFMACGAIEAKVYCAGGTHAYGSGSTSTYVYDPGSDTWSRRADLPMSMQQTAYTVANGRLLLSSGVYEGLSTNKGFSYDPVADSWSPLPDAINQLSRGGSACGFITVGGAQSWSNYTPFVAMLPGYDDCGSDRDEPWLSEGRTTLTIAPGHSASVGVRLDAGSSGVTQPGTYTSTLLVRGDTPYGGHEVPITMRARAPRGWGKLMGTVTGVACDGTTAPVAGADVWVGAGGDRHALVTDANGRYALWLDSAGNPVQVVSGKDGWSTATDLARIRSAKATVTDLTLHRASCT